MLVLASDAHVGAACNRSILCPPDLVDSVADSATQQPQHSRPTHTGTPCTAHPCPNDVRKVRSAAPTHVLHVMFMAARPTDSLSS